MANKAPAPDSSASLTVALLYTRVSSDEQAREGVSLDVHSAKAASTSPGSPAG